MPLIPAFVGVIVALITSVGFPYLFDPAQPTMDSLLFGAPSSGANYVANTLKLPNLLSKGCIGTDGSGLVIEGTCTGGPGGGLSSYDAWTHPQSGTSATTSGMIFTAASSTFTRGLSITSGTTTFATSTNLYVSGQTRLGALASSLVLSGSTGILSNYTGASCTNQALTALSAAGASTCNSITASDLASADFGSFTCNGSACTVDNDAITLATQTTGNYLATLSSSGSITVGGSGSENAAGTVNLNMANANTWTALQSFSNGIISTSSSTDLYLTTILSTSTNATTTNLYVTNPPTFSTLTSALLLTGAGGLLAEYTGSSCTNQTVTAISALGVATCTTINGNYLDLTANYTWTGAHDFGGGVLEIPNGSNPTIDILGEAAIDSTANELLYATSSVATAPAVIKPYINISFSFATSTAGLGTSTRSLAPADAAGYFDSIQCDSNSFYRVLLYDAGGNRMNDFIASSTVGTVKLTTNNTFTAGEGILVDIGTTTAPTGAKYLGCRARYFFTRN